MYQCVSMMHLTCSMVSTVGTYIVTCAYVSMMRLTCSMVLVPTWLPVLVFQRCVWPAVWRWYPAHEGRLWHGPGPCRCHHLQWPQWAHTAAYRWWLVHAVISCVAMAFHSGTLLVFTGCCGWEIAHIFIHMSRISSVFTLPPWNFMTFSAEHHCVYSLKMVCFC